MDLRQTDMVACIFNIQKFSIHDGPGIRTTVFFKGCPLRCKWCSNPESQAAGVQPEREPALAGKSYTLDEIMDVCLADKDFYTESGGGVTLSGGEALAQPDFALKLLQALQSQKIHTALETTGLASPDIFLEAVKHTDLFLFDIKHYNDEKHMEGTCANNKTILQNLKLAALKGADILIRIPVIPGYNDSLADARGFSGLLKQYGLNKVQLLPFHQFGLKKYELLGMPYAFSNAKTLHPEDLRDYLLEMENSGLSCFF